MVTALVRRYTKRGELMATFVLEDLRASIEVFVFPKVMAELGALLADDAIVVLRGRVDTRDDQVKLVCMEVDAARAGRRRGVRAPRAGSRSGSSPTTASTG